MLGIRGIRFAFRKLGLGGKGKDFFFSFHFEMGGCWARPVVFFCEFFRGSVFHTHTHTRVPFR